MIREEELSKDRISGTNSAEAEELKWWVLHYIDQKKLVTADDIYKDSECGDIAMYLALHQLVTRNLIEGLSPYDERSKGHNHHQMQFRRAMNDQAMLFSHAAERMAKDWDPNKWGVNTVCP